MSGHAENGGLVKSVEPGGTESSEVLLTPTEAAAAGDIVLTFNNDAHGKEPVVLVDNKDMGNKGSVDITPVKLSSFGDKGPQAGVKRGMLPV